jgi:hypothetical protein
MREKEERDLAFGITRKELTDWKRRIDQGEIAFLTHFWIDDRFPESKTVTKVGCKDIDQLIQWGKQYGLKPEWLDIRKDGYTHFDLIGHKQKEILTHEGLIHHIWK